MTQSDEQRSTPFTLGKSVRTAFLRGLSIGAIVGSGIGVVMVVGAFAGGVWSAWRAGRQLEPPSLFLTTTVLGYTVAGALIMAVYGGAIGAFGMGLFAAARHRWTRDKRDSPEDHRN